SLGAELATNVVPTAPPDERWIVASVWSGLAAMLAWLIATCVAGARLAARLAAGTLHLPNVRLRVRALQVRAVFVLIPWTTAMAIFAGALTGVRGLLVAVAGELLALLIVQLVLAQLAARGRALAAAELRSSR
ncbi:MAG TPA: hypothetical protein VL463_04735, partial [Kofleriaceae bacterium]|nr:hypothetical protein [Kofleriaceae bacterium]